jgi:hypothetical protein
MKIYFSRGVKNVLVLSEEKKKRLVVVTDGVSYILGRRSGLQVSIRTVDADVGTACVIHRQTLTATT